MKVKLKKAAIIHRDAVIAWLKKNYTEYKLFYQDITDERVYELYKVPKHMPLLIIYPNSGDGIKAHFEAIVFAPIAQISHSGYVPEKE